MISRIHSSIVFTTALLCLPCWLAHAVDYSDEYAEEAVYEESIPQARDLSADADRARREQIPLMIEFSTAWCEYCRALEEQVLQPMLNSGDYDDRVIVRKLMVDAGESLTDFSGERTSAASFANRAGVEIYPTIVFFDADGREISERIVGITVIDYVSQFIDESLQRATRELQ